MFPGPDWNRSRDFPAAAGAAAGAIGGAYQDVKEYFKTQRENERSYQEGTRAQERIQRKRRGEN